MRDRFLGLLARTALQRTNLVLGVALLLTAVSGTTAALFLGLDSDQDHLVSADLEHQARYLDFLETFGDREHFYVVVEVQPDVAAARSVVAQVASDLRAQPELFQQVSTGFEPQAFQERALLMAPEREVDQLQAHAGELRELGQLTSYASLFALWTERLQQADSADGDGDPEVGFRFLRQLLDELAQPGSHPPADLLEPLLPSFTIEAEDTELRVGDLLLVTAAPRRNFAELNPVEAPLTEARAALARALAAHPGVSAGLTGRPVISADEISRINADTPLSAVIALLGVGLVFVLFFRSVLRPLLAIAALLVGIALTAGFATVAVGTLNFLSSVFLIILIGLGIDYGVHFLARYQAQRAGGQAQTQAIEAAVLESGRGNLTAALSSSLAFYSMLFTDFRGLSELGLIAGTGILICCLTTLLVLPALLVRFEPADSLAHELPTFDVLERLHAHPRAILLASLLLALVAAPALYGFRFEENLLALQAAEEDSVRWERRLMEGEGNVWIAASRVSTLAEAYTRQAEYAALDSSLVAYTEGPADFFGPRIEQRRTELEALAKRLGPPPAGVEPTGPDALEEAALELADALSAAAEGALRRGGEATAYVDPLLELVDRCEALSADALDAERLGAQERAFFTELGQRYSTLRRLTRPEPWSLETLPEPIHRHLVGDDGSFAVYVYPKQDVWDPTHMARFLTETRTVDPEITGSTVSLQVAGDVLRESFQISTAVTLVAVLVTLLLDFRGRSALLALVPLALGAVWLAEAMGALGLSLNMANFFCVPILLGLGIDDGVHMVHRAQEAPGEPLAGHAAGTGVILSSLTTAIGFGSLTISSHAGLASLGFVMALGAMLLLVAAVGVIPALVRLNTRRA